MRGPGLSNGIAGLQLLLKKYIYASVRNLEGLTLVNSCRNFQTTIEISANKTLQEQQSREHDNRCLQR
jgi:hypothetical protein